MFKIEDNIPYEPTLSGKKAQEKQAIINTIALLKVGQSIFIPDTTIQWPPLKRFIEGTLKERFSQKNLMYKEVEERGIKGTRIWCDPTKAKSVQI